MVIIIITIIIGGCFTGRAPPGWTPIPFGRDPNASTPLRMFSVWAPPGL